MKPIIVFIDDSKFEHELVAGEIAPAAPEFYFVQTYTFDEARKALGQRRPALFLLDLWGQDPEVKTPFLTPKDELERKIAAFPTLEHVYGGLDEFRGDVNNEYLKRLFSIVDRWRSLFESVCARVGQNRRYGLDNLNGVRTYYPAVPAVFYTRKSLINDAVAMIHAGADGVFIKPTGADDGETRRLTRAYAPTLAAGLAGIMEKGGA